MNQAPIIIFDGVCNLCNASVDFVIRHDRKQLFFFAPNQSQKGKALLQSQGKAPTDIQTVLLWENGKLYQHSTAALRIARLLPWPWKLLYGFILVPSFIRDGIYRWIARNRYRWFGKRDSCRLPSPAERARFLN